MKDLENAGLIIEVISLILKMPVSNFYRQSRRFYWICLVLLPALVLGQENVLNSLDLYQTESPVICRFATLDQNPAWIYAVLDFKQPVEDSLWISYSQVIGNDLLQDSIHVKPTRQRQIIKYRFDDGFPANVMITISFSWNSRNWKFQEHFPRIAYHSTGQVSLWQSSVPILKTWIQQGESLLVKSELTDSVYTYYYSHKFDPARPPMAVKPGKGGAALVIDSVFTLKAGQLYTPDKQGLYFFQSDSSSTEGIGLMVTDRFFPKPQDISDLTEPLIYLSTRSEFQSLKEDLSSKQALDKFWLSTVGTPERARAAIKNFYQYIEDANALFSSYKEGWKTDRGMIYTVMGPPLEVGKLLDGENWIYRDAVGEQIVFQFIKVSNIFSNNHYELFRDKSYDRLWFIAIDRWREGNNP